MPTKILIVESPAVKIVAATWPTAEVIQVNQIKDKAGSKGTEPVLVFGGFEIKDDPQLTALLDDSAKTFSFVQFSRAEDATHFAAKLAFLQVENRSTGIKEALGKGSTIFTESYFGASALGAKLDACHTLAAKTLKPDLALSAFASIQAMVFLGLKSMASHGAGDKVDLQIGSDGSIVACSVYFKIPRGQLQAFRKHPILETLRAAAGFFELRFHRDGSALEIFSAFFPGESPDWPIECHSFVPTTPLEEASAVKEYTFRLLNTSREGQSEIKAVDTSPFKKKFSDKMKSAAPTPVDAARGPIVTPAAKLAPPTGPDLSEKVQLLESAVREKEKLLAQLGEEMMNLKASAAQTKKNPAAGDAAQMQALKATITQLEGELADALEREQEQESQESLPPGIKDQLLRKIKDLEVKLKSATDERSSKIMGLEKQIEDQKKKAKDMSKRITELTEQLRDAA